MRLSHLVRAGLASRAPGFALIPSLTCQTCWRRRRPQQHPIFQRLLTMTPPSPDAAVAIEGSEMRAIFFVSAMVAMVAGVATAEAGGFAVREQSAYGQGSSFAGMAAPGDLISSMFWNPAAVTTATGTDRRGQSVSRSSRARSLMSTPRVRRSRRWALQAMAAMLARPASRRQAILRCLSPTSSISA